MMTLDMGRVREQIDYVDRRMNAYLEMGRNRVKRFVGDSYSDNGWKTPQPQNLMALQVNIVQRYLVSSNPRALMTARARHLAAEALSFELAVNRLCERIRLGDMISDCTQTAMLRGIAPVCITKSYDGIVDVHKIDPDDFLIDMTARSEKEVQFVGYRLREPTEKIKSNMRYDPEVRSKASLSSDKGSVGSQGRERTSSIGTGSDSGQRPLVDMTDLIYLYFPLHGVTVKILDDGSADVLEVLPWTGPDGGPIRWLSFIRVDGNILGLAPTALTENMHDTINVVSAKVSQQAIDQKTVGVAPLSGHKDTDNIINASDGEIINSATPGQIAMFKFNGADPSSINFVNLWRNFYMEIAGNLQTLGGLGPQADTLGQERMLSETASKLVDSMQESTIEFTAAIMRDIAFYRWHDDQATDYVPKRVGTSEMIETFGPVRNGTWSDYDIQLDPFSMRRKTPGQRLNEINAFVTQIYMQMEPRFAQSGVVLDAFKFLEINKRMRDNPELDQIFTYSEPNQMALDASPSNPQTHSVYERVNRPGALRQQQNEVLAQQMMGGDRQPAEMASANRVAQ